MEQPDNSIYVGALSGTIVTDRVSPLYMLGLLIVAIAMVLLPLIYIAMIGGVVYLVYLHATVNTSIFAGGGPGLLKMLAYFGPIVIGAILIFFMIKPLFVRAGGETGAIELAEEQQPELFAFVASVCSCVGAPVPKRIDIDCQANASASFRTRFEAAA